MKSLENQLFTWEGWDGDQEMMIFYGATLVVPIGVHPVGTRFDHATILYERSLLQLQRGDEIHEYGLKLEVA